MSQTSQSAEIAPEQMTMKSEFTFACHKDVECFTRCCRGIDIMLTPYDILTMRKKLGLTSEQFLAAFTTPQILEKADMPVVTLKLLEDEKNPAPLWKITQDAPFMKIVQLPAVTIPWESAH